MFLGIFEGLRSSEISEGHVPLKFPMQIPRNISLELPRIGPSEISSEYTEEVLPRYIPRNFPTIKWSSEFPRKFSSLEFRQKFPRDFRGKMNFRGVISEDFCRRVGDSLYLLVICSNFWNPVKELVSSLSVGEVRRLQNVDFWKDGELGAWFQFISFLSRREVRFMFGLLQVQGEEPIPQPDILMASSNDFSSIWCFSDCICYGSRPLRLDYVEVWTSERAFEPGDDIVWKALGGSDRSGLRRRSVFYSTSGLYHLAG
ncbi:hypothetical protein DY000_02041909 [Brassica cretica]|uniref:F-box associated domain-containing protein n=1 Tax=Brassica cretica TaxID=69181 RepID=A0ABQ7BE89_BRACR|nr:hypothetical protein DY000_02041909 [Brassica cretica]